MTETMGSFTYAIMAMSQSAMEVMICMVVSVIGQSVILTICLKVAIKCWREWK